MTQNNTEHTGKKGTVSQRRYERVFLENCTAEIYPQGSLFVRLIHGKIENLGLALLDISECGLRCSTLRLLPVNSRVRVVARIPHFGEVLEGMARVVWAAPSREIEGQFMAGLDYVSVVDGHVSKVQHLRKALNSPEIRQKLQTQKRTSVESAPGTEKEENGGLEIIPPSNL